jgi:hypothetical protein
MEPINSRLRKPFDQVLSFGTILQLLESTLESTSQNGGGLVLTNVTCRNCAYHGEMYRINDFQPTQEKPFVLGLPTGSSPIPTYKYLIRLVKEGKLSCVWLVLKHLCEWGTDWQSVAQI